MNKVQKHLQFTCSQCFSTFQLFEIHERETNNCEASCIQQWQALLSKHYQDCIILQLAKEEAEKDQKEAPND